MRQRGEKSKNPLTSCKEVPALQKGSFICCHSIFSPSACISHCHSFKLQPLLLAISSSLIANLTASLRPHSHSWKTPTLWQEGRPCAVA